MGPEGCGVVDSTSQLSDLVYVAPNRGVCTRAEQLLRAVERPVRSWRTGAGSPFTIEPGKNPKQRYLDESTGRLARGREAAFASPRYGA